MVGPFDPTGFDGMPGMTPRTDGESRVFLRNTSWTVADGAIMKDDSKDTQQVADKQHILRSGLAVVRIEAGDHKGKFVNLGHALAPADPDMREVGILYNYSNMLKQGGAIAFEDKQARIIVGAIVDDEKVLYGTALDAVPVNPARIDAFREAADMIHFHQKVV